MNESSPRWRRLNRKPDSMITPTIEPITRIQVRCVSARRVEGRMWPVPRPASPAAKNTNMSSKTLRFAELKMSTTAATDITISPSLNVNDKCSTGNSVVASLPPLSQKRIEAKPPITHSRM